MVEDWGLLATCSINLPINCTYCFSVFFGPKSLVSCISEIPCLVCGDCRPDPVDPDKFGQKKAGYCGPDKFWEFRGGQVQSGQISQPSVRTKGAFSGTDLTCKDEQSLAEFGNISRV
jgi:hypothetical protein